MAGVNAGCWSVFGRELSGQQPWGSSTSWQTEPRTLLACSGETGSELSDQAATTSSQSCLLKDIVITSSGSWLAAENAENLVD